MKQSKHHLDLSDMFTPTHSAWDSVEKHDTLFSILASVVLVGLLVAVFLTFN